MKYIIRLMILPMFIFYFCTKKGNNEKLIVNFNITEGISNIKKINLSIIATDMSIIPLETNDSCGIGDIYNISFSENFLVIIDNLSQVILYDKNGRFIGKAGKKGKGPGEILNPLKAIISEKNDEFYVLDPGLKQLAVFSLTERKFKMKYSLNLLAGDFTLSLDSVFFFASTLPAIEYSNKSQLHSFSRFGSIKRQSNKTSNTELEKFKNYPWGFVKLFIKRDTVYYWESNKDTVYRINNDLTTLPIYCFTVDKKYKIPNRIKENKGEYEKIKGNYFKMDKLIETTKYIFLEGVIGNKMRNIFIDKSDLSCYDIVFNYEIKDSGFHNDFDGGYPFWPVGSVSKDELFAYIEPVRLKKLMSNSYFKDIAIKRPDLRKQLDSILYSAKISDNPIIYKVKLKINEN